MATKSNVAATRWGRFAAGCITMLVIGFIYGWSVFCAPLQEEFGWNAAMFSFNFTLLMWAFCAGSIIGAKITLHTSERVTLILTAVFIFAAFAATSWFLTANNPWLLYVTFGVLGGLGVGFAYNAVMGVVVPWFPDKTGTASGALLLFYCFGTMVLSSVAAAMFESMGWRLAYIVLSAAIAVIIVLCMLVLRKPNAEELAALPQSKLEEHRVNSDNEPDYTSLQMVKTPTFWKYMLWMMMISSIGLGLAGTNNQLALGAGASIAGGVAAVSTWGITAGVSRLIYGVIVDNLGLRVALILAPVVHVIGLIGFVVGTITGNLVIYFGSVGLVGLGNGGLSTCASTFSAKYYGSHHYAENLAIINLTLIPAALIGPTILSSSVMATETYLVGLCAFIGLAALSFVFAIMTKRSLAKMQSAKVETSTQEPAGSNA